MPTNPGRQQVGLVENHQHLVAGDLPDDQALCRLCLHPLGGVNYLQDTETYSYFQRSEFPWPLATKISSVGQGEGWAKTLWGSIQNLLTTGKQVHDAYQHHEINDLGPADDGPDEGGVPGAVDKRQLKLGEALGKKKDVVKRNFSEHYKDGWLLEIQLSLSISWKFLRLYL